MTGEVTRTPPDRGGAAGVAARRPLAGVRELTIGAAASGPVKFTESEVLEPVKPEPDDSEPDEPEPDEPEPDEPEPDEPEPDEPEPADPELELGLPPGTATMAEN